MGIFQVQYDCRYHGSRIGSPMIQLSFPFAVCQRQGHIHCRGYFIGRTDRDFVQRVPSCRGSIALCRFKFDDFLPHHLFPVTGCDPPVFGFDIVDYHGVIPSAQLGIDNGRHTFAGSCPGCQCCMQVTVIHQKGRGDLAVNRGKNFMDSF